MQINTYPEADALADTIRTLCATRERLNLAITKQTELAIEADEAGDDELAAHHRVQVDAAIRTRTERTEQLAQAIATADKAVDRLVYLALAADRRAIDLARRVAPSYALLTIDDRTRADYSRHLARCRRLLSIAWVVWASIPGRDLDDAPLRRKQRLAGCQW